jgi:hypothetical protein
VMVCPLCQSGIVLTGEDVHTLFARHEATECASQRKAREAAKAGPKCGKCSKALIAGLSSTCSACRRTHCLEHRFPQSHDCGRRSAPRPAQRPAPRPASAPSAPAVPRNKSPAELAAEAMRATAARRMQQPGASGGAGAAPAESSNGCTIS